MPDCAATQRGANSLAARSASSCRSARHCRQAVLVNKEPSFLELAAERRLGEKNTRQTQELVCLAHFSFQRFDALLFGSGWFGTQAGIVLLLAYLVTQRSGVHSILIAMDLMAPAASSTRCRHR